VSAANIRYYESQGLLSPAGRADNSYQGRPAHRVIASARRPRKAA